jgi:hypothetical protein
MTKGGGKGERARTRKNMQGHEQRQQQLTYREQQVPSEEEVYYS